MKTFPPDICLPLKQLKINFKTFDNSVCLIFTE